MRHSPAIALRLQSMCLAGLVAELGSRHHSRAMKFRHLLSFGLAAMLVSCCSTAARKEAPLAINKMFTEAFAPIYAISLFRSGAIDIFYCSASFRHKNDRWPKDYAELSAFVKQSDGYLMLGEYERVDLRPLVNDGLEIRYVRPGHTNEMKLTLDGPGETK